MATTRRPAAARRTAKAAAPARAATASKPVSTERPGGVSILAWLHVASAVLSMVGVVVGTAFIGAIGSQIDGAEAVVGLATLILFLSFGVSVFQLWWARSFYRLDAGAYTPGIVLSILMIVLGLSSILSLALGIGTLVYLLQGHVKALFGR